MATRRTKGRLVDNDKPVAAEGSLPESGEDDSDDDVVTTNRRPAYALLRSDDDQSSESAGGGSSDEEEEAAVQARQAPAAPKGRAATAKKANKAKEGNQKSGGGGRPENGASDIDKLVAMIEDRGGAKASHAEAAEKKRAKRERQKAAKKAVADTDVATDKVKGVKAERRDKAKGKEQRVDAVPEVETKQEDEPEADAEDQSEAAAGKKKKVAKGATKEKKKKTPADLIKQMLKKRQEEEERLRQLELEEERRLQELERERQEKERLEMEKKEKKKQKEKERIERLKKEGKYLTAEQKQKLQRQRAMVEALKQQGYSVPDIKNDEAEEAKKKPRPVYDKKKRREAPKPVVNEKPLMDTDASSQIPVEQQQVVIDEVIDSWDQIETSTASANVNKAKAEIVKEPSSESEPSTKSSSDSANCVEHKSADDALLEKAKPDVNNVEDGVEKEVEGGYRSPVICVLGHVDTGKTKILDKIRHTHVQDSEAGGITQQIGATFVPKEALLKLAGMVPGMTEASVHLPGLLIIDTPGHESFSNLRSRGSSLCDLAILVVDIMHGIEQQTLESINLLKKRGTPFFVALNKVDRLYQWKGNAGKDVRQTLKAQQANATIEFKERVKETVLQFAEQGLNAALFWENTDPDEYVSLVPTSAHTGDGMGNLMACLVDFCQTKLTNRLQFKKQLDCTVLEVKQIAGLGTTIDVILVNGYLHVGDTMVVAGSEGPIVTQIRELLMPHPLRELRVKNPYVHNKTVRGAQGIKVVGRDLEKALAGLPLLVAKSDDEVEAMKEEISHSLKQVLQSVRLSERGVYVQASTLGSLEALLEFLKSQKIPYFGINVGPVHKRDVMKVSTMLQHDEQWAVILAFDVKIERDAQQLADELGVRVFQADIIYHLQDAFLKYREELRERRKQEVAHLAIFPCKLRILPQHVYKSRDPIVIGVFVDDGILKIGVPLCIPSKENLFIGTVSSIEQNHKEIQTVRKGAEVCVKIENTTGDAPKMYGRHFDHEDFLVSRISRETIDVCKEFFRDELQKSDWQLIVELKKVFEIL